MSFPRYPKYKDSGVESFGQVPTHWKVEPFKRHICLNDGGVWGNDPSGIGDTMVLRSTEQSVDGQWELDSAAFRSLSESDVKSALLEAGDLLMTKSSGSSLHIGKTTLVSEQVAALHCCYSNFMQRIRLQDSLIPCLVWRFLNNTLARRQFEILSNTSTGLANLNGAMIGQVLVPIAPVKEQSQLPPSSTTKPPRSTR